MEKSILMPSRKGQWRAVKVYLFSMLCLCSYAVIYNPSGLGVCVFPCPTVVFKGIQSKAVWSPEALHYQWLIEHITSVQFAFKTKCVDVKTCSALDVKTWALPKSTKRGWHLVRIFHCVSWSLPLLDNIQMHNTQAASLGRAGFCSSSQTPSPVGIKASALMPTACAQPVHN